MYRLISSPIVAAVLGLGLCVGVLPGCSNAPKKTVQKETPNLTTVVSPRRDYSNETMVRVYSLNGLGLKDAPAEEIQAFMETVRDMVVTKDWDRTKSTIQVFGVLCTVRTTPENHLLLEDYLNQVQRVMDGSVYPMRSSVR